MFTRIHTLFFVFLFALCVSASVPRRDVPSASCTANTGTQQCCNQLEDAGNPLVNIIASLLGIAGDLTGQVGLTCDPIVGGSQCNSQAVCCTGNSFGGGVLVVGCSPININL